MAKYVLLLLWPLLIPLPAWAGYFAPRPDESVEPALRFEVRVDGKAVRMADGETVQLDGAFSSPAITLRVPKHREFRYGGLSFKYPRDFAFQADLSGAYQKHWALSGSRCRIAVYVVPAAMTKAEFVNKMTELYGKANCDVLNVSANLKTHSLELTGGTTLKIRIGVQSMKMEIFPIPTQAATRRFLIVQEATNRSKKRFREAVEAIELLRSSLSVHNVP